MLIRKCAATALLVAFALAGCGGGDDDGGGGSEDGGGNEEGAAAKTACNAYCDATVSCPLFAYMDVTECKSYECGSLDQTSGACATSFKTYYDCVNAKTDVCDETGCQIEVDACM